MYTTIEKLRDISARWLAGEPLSAEQAHWLGESLTRFLDHMVPSLDASLGLGAPVGGMPWWREEAIRNRNAALSALAEDFFGDLSPCAQAREVWTLATRYGASAWRHDRARHALPAHYPGTPKEYLYRAFQSGATMPVCVRQLRTILGRS